MTETSATILERIRRNHGADIDLTLRTPYRDLLAALGNPQNKLPPVIHVAGTNGKGSTCAFLRAMIEAAGYKVHVYTSPHLVTFHERLRIAGTLIGEKELVEILVDAERRSAPGSITFFEMATVAAFVAFSRHPADVAIFEVGLGGRLDATNVIPQPAATVITRLSFDHREYLGTTMAQIAREKAGILRPHVPCFSAPQPSAEALSALRHVAAELQAPLAVGGADWRVESHNKDGFIFTSPHRTLELPTPALVGQHQLWNAGLALATLEAVPLEIPDDACRQAMTHVEWPARLQHLKEGRLPKLLPEDWELWLDGGHNDSAGEVLAAQIKKWQQEDKVPRPLSVVFGMLSTKVPGEFLAPLVPYIDQLRTVAVDNEPLSLSADELARLTREAGIRNVAAAPTLSQALSEFRATATKAGRVLICGSLYLAGQALTLNAAKSF